MSTSSYRVESFQTLEIIFQSIFSGIKIEWTLQTKSNRE